MGESIIEKRAHASIKTKGPITSIIPQLPHHTVCPKKYAHGFVVLCFVVVMQSFIMNSHEVFIHIYQGCFVGTGAIVRLPQCQWSKPDGYGKISQCITTTKHSKAKTVCIFLGIYCISKAQYKKDITPLLMHWSCTFLALTHRYDQLPVDYPLQVLGCLPSTLMQFSTSTPPPTPIPPPRPNPQSQPPIPNPPHPQPPPPPPNCQFSDNRRISHGHRYKK